jgi:hypothetical protein
MLLAGTVGGMSSSKKPAYREGGIVVAEPVGQLAPALAVMVEQTRSRLPEQMEGHSLRPVDP